MKLTPYNINDIPGRKLAYRKTKNLEILEEFINSGVKCCEVENFTQASAAICCSTLKASAKRYGFNQITVTFRGERVFLILEDEK